MNIINKLNWRYATKKFDASRKLSKKKIEILAQAFNLTATSYGLQTLKMVVLSDEDIQNKMVKICYGQEQIKNASHVLVICIQKSVSDDDVDKYYDNIINVRNTPEVILSKYRKELKSFINSKSSDEIESWCINQAYIVLGNLMTVCAVEGIDACPMEGFIPEEVDKLLELDKHDLKSILLLPVGYRAEDDIFANFKKVRKDLSETVIHL